MIDTKALREKVLDLAIRGKLVPQDPNDEPASVLLERIRAEKEQMVKDGKLKAKDIKNDTIIFKGDDNLHYEQFPDGTVKCIEDEIPFELPEGWVWSRLNALSAAQLNAFVDGPFGSNLKTEHYTTNREVRIIQLNNIGDFVWKNTGIKYTTFEHAESLDRCKTYPNDIVIAKMMPAGRAIIVPSVESIYVISSDCVRLRVADSINTKYIMFAINSPVVNAKVQDSVHGIGRSRTSLSKCKELLVPIPPMREQTLICETIEAVFSLLITVETSREELSIIINSLKSQILDLAIRGKLVSQNLDDEPASILLERIRDEKEELIKQGKIKRGKKESVIFKGEDNSYYEKIGNDIVCIDEEIPFDLPNGWIWCRGYSCFSGMATKKPNGEYFYYIDIDSIDNKSHKVKQPKHILVKDAPSRASRAVQAGSVLFSFVRPYLENIAYIDESISDSIASTGFYVCNSNGLLNSRFLYYLMISEYVIQGLNQYMKGDNSPSISKDNIEHWLYPIPPINEQKGICEKIDNLLNLIVVIEQSLN